MQSDFEIRAAIDEWRTEEQRRRDQMLTAIFGAHGTSEFEELVVEYFNDDTTGFEEDLNEYCESYADDVCVDDASLVSENEETISVRLSISYTDCKTTGCDACILTESRTIEATATIAKEKPHLIYELALAPKWEPDGDYY